MRIYTLAFIASTAVPTCSTGVSMIHSFSITEANSTASVPTFVDDSNHAPVNRLSKANNTWNSEERAPRSTPSNVVLALEAVKKTIMVKLYGGISRQELTVNGWRHVISHDDKILTRVGKNILANEEQDVEALRDLVKAAVENHQTQYISEIESHLTSWVKHQPPERLVAALKEVGFFKHLNRLSVQALDNSIGESNKARLFNTISEGFNGVAGFASALSIAKQSLVTGHDAESIQSSLLAFWKEEKKPISEVITLLDLKEKDWTYETLDTLIEYVALLTNKRKEVYPDMIEHLRVNFGLDKVAEKVMKEHTSVQPVASHLRKTYGDDITATGKEHDEFAKQLQTGLLYVLFTKGINPSDLVNNPYHLPGVYAEELKAEYTAYYEKRLELSMSPPGT